MSTKLNRTERLFKDHGMQSVSLVTPVDGAAGELLLGNITISKDDIPWIAGIISSGFNSSGVFDASLSQYEIVESIKTFYEDYIPTVPEEMRAQKGSTSDDGLLCNWLLLHAINPDCYIESGVFIGSSLRLADVMLPDSKKWAYDLSFRPLLHKSEMITYIEDEWSHKPPSLKENQRVFAFFDDHIDPVRRLAECHELGVEWVLFDDSPAFTRLNFYRYPAVPSISMILDDNMPDGAILEWHHHSEKRRLRYTHDKKYCQKARDIIASHLDMRELMGKIGLSCGDKVIVRLIK